MLTSWLIGLGVLLWFGPSCLTERNEYQRLLDRVESEQVQQFTQLFKDASVRSWPWMIRLRKDQRLREKLSRLVGLDLERTADTLSRLRLAVSVEEILLVRLGGSIILLGLLFYTAALYSWQKTISTVDVLPLLGGLGFFLCPTWLLNRLDDRAKRQIRSQVPAFFSIVQALVEAGMPIYGAVMATAKRARSRLGRELASLELAEKRHGNWRRALEELAFRWSVDSLMSIAADIDEAITKGTSISELLAMHIEEHLRQQEDEAAAQVNRLTVRLLPLLIVCMGVPLLFLVMGPSFIGIREQL
ncbi:type II secretion system F family protein [Brevibacillus humidisoli]|uniref:type II secretion system F family protein n=1 Tax=Brevibacillus humidisoli TaxID=2895522 RepID=UPI001E501C61|nr:type II secretion system F family protein [Brevibacillus humidisoli]UFJ40580.1 type II secretion system F family protein [Brevibacillus humidisoli]